MRRELCVRQLSIKKITMTTSASAESKLATVLKIQAAVLFFGLPLLVFVLRFPGWPWNPSHYKYEYMIVATYMALGFFLWKAAASPLQHALFYDFVIWGAYGVHATVMLIETFMEFGTEWQHIMPYGDVPALYIFAIMLWYYKRQAGLKSE